MSNSLNCRPGREADLSFVVALQKKFSNQLGFLPTAAIEVYLRDQHVVLVEQNGEVAGYILGRPSLRYDRRITPMTQVAVCMDAQRRGAGMALVAYREMLAAAYGCINSQAWCADDIDAVEFWRGLGYQPLARRTPRNARGRSLTLWRRVIGQTQASKLICSLPPVAGWKAAADETIVKLDPATGMPFVEIATADAPRTADALLFDVAPYRIGPSHRVV